MDTPEADRQPHFKGDRAIIDVQVTVRGVDYIGDRIIHIHREQTIEATEHAIDRAANEVCGDIVSEVTEQTSHLRFATPADL